MKHYCEDQQQGEKENHGKRCAFFKTVLPVSLIVLAAAAPVLLLHCARDSRAETEQSGEEIVLRVEASSEEQITYVIVIPSAEESTCSAVEEASEETNAPDKEGSSEETGISADNGLSEDQSLSDSKASSENSEKHSIPVSKAAPKEQSLPESKVSPEETRSPAGEGTSVSPPEETETEPLTAPEPARTETAETERSDAENETRHLDAEYEIIHHEPEYEERQVWVTDREAHSETISGYRCFYCGQFWTDAEALEMRELDEIWNHVLAHPGDGETGPYGGYASFGTDSISVYVEESGHYETERILIREAWDELVPLREARDETLSFE